MNVVTLATSFEGAFFFIGLWVSLFALLVLYNRSKKKCGLIGWRSADYNALKTRLSHYALMIGHEKADKYSIPRLLERPWGSRSLKQQSYYLTTGEHKILLGALKKIEAKNAVLTAITVFLLAVGTKIYYDVHGSLDRYRRPGFLIALVVTFILLVPRLEGNGHLGQRSFNRIKAKTYWQGSDPLGTAMQKQLMLDLLRKEANFDFSYKVVASVLFATIGLIFLPLLIVR